MTLEAKIHTIWPTVPALEALLPVARVFTGRAPRGSTMPYASIQRPAGTVTGRTDKATVKQVQLRIQVWHTDFDAGQAIHDAIESAFENRDFDLTDGKVIDLEPDSKYWLEEPDTEQQVFQFVTTFTAHINRARTQ